MILLCMYSVSLGFLWATLVKPKLHVSYIPETGVVGDTYCFSWPFYESRGQNSSGVRNSCRPIPVSGLLAIPRVVFRLDGEIAPPSMIHLFRNDKGLGVT